jgi:hypothetical protein
VAVSQEQLDEWLAHPVTRELRLKLARDRQNVMEIWAAGGFSDDTEFKTAVKEAAAIRHCQVLQTLLDLEPGDFDPNE